MDVGLILDLYVPTSILLYASGEGGLWEKSQTYIYRMATMNDVSDIAKFDSHKKLKYNVFQKQLRFCRDIALKFLNLSNKVVLGNQLLRGIIWSAVPLPSFIQFLVEVGFWWGSIPNR